MTDEELRMMADSQPTGPSWIRDVLLELLEHRTRIAAHAAAHPERLSVGEIDAIKQALQAKQYVAGTVVNVGDRMVTAEGIALVDEIQQRRAADLTPDQVTALRHGRDIVNVFATSAGVPTSDQATMTRAVEAIDIILRAHGATP